MYLFECKHKVCFECAYEHFEVKLKQENKLATCCQCNKPLSEKDLDAFINKYMIFISTRFNSLDVNAMTARCEQLFTAHENILLQIGLNSSGGQCFFLNPCAFLTQFFSRGSMSGD